MAGEIHNYQNEALTFGDDDFYDIDFYTGTGYETKKIKGSTIKNAILNAVTPPTVKTLYSEDGELVGNRTVNGVNSYSLLMTNLTTFGVDVIGGEGVDAVVFNVPVNESLKSFVIVNSANQNPMFAVENGYVCINDKYKLPLVDGQTNEVLTTDGAGNLYWSLPTPSNVPTIYSQNANVVSNRSVNGANYTIDFSRFTQFLVEINMVDVPMDAVIFDVPAMETNDQFVVRVGKNKIFHITNGQTVIANQYGLPVNDGQTNQVLTTDGAGQATWQNATSGGMQTGTTAQMLALTGQTTGTQFFNTTLTKVFTYSDNDLWFVVGETMIMNKPAVENFVEGMLLVPEPNATKSAEIAVSSATNEILGVNVFPTSDNQEQCVVAYAGIWNVLCSDDTSYDVADFLVHDGSSGEDGFAKLRSSGSGHMAIVLEDREVATGGGLVLCQVQTTERF